MRRLKLGTRGSALALWQANYVKTELEMRGAEIDLTIISSHGDRDHSGPIADLGAQGVFTREIQRALLDGTIDFAVHSMKDLPTEEADGLFLASVPIRGDTRDVLVSSKYRSVREIESGSRIGTGSLRRKTQLIHLFKKLIEHEPDRTDCWRDIEITDIRGNVDTRLRKLDQGEFDAIILASAGLERLGFAERIAGYLNAPDFLPAVGQGALAIETRKEDYWTIETVRRINDRKTHWGILAERAMLERLEGGCIAPIGALASWSEDGGDLTLSGRILSLDGTDQFDAIRSISLSGSEETAARQLGVETADLLLTQGASGIIAELNAKRGGQ